MPNAYFRLLRLHQPTGIWLLLWPSLWSVAMASGGFPSLKLLALFGAGAVVMRSAGCVVNDIIDRKFDAKVERTRTRPLASGEVTLWDAVVLVVILLCIALIIAMQMKTIVLYLAVASLALVAAYPFMKRITWWPQAFLGLAFNWGALMGWAAVTGRVGLPAILLYIGGIFWTLGYDTIYAHQDKGDDAKIGVKSTALLLGVKSRQWIGRFYTGAAVFWLFAGMANHSGEPYFVGLGLAVWHLFRQARRVNLDDPASCLSVFRSNVTLGAFLFGGICIDDLRMALLHYMKFTGF